MNLIFGIGQRQGIIVVYSGNKGKSRGGKVERVGGRVARMKLE